MRDMKLDAQINVSKMFLTSNANSDKELKSSEINIPIAKQNAKFDGELKEPVKPVRPKPTKVKVIILKHGDIVSSFLNKYHVTLKDVEKANPGVNLGDVREGQKIKMPYVDQKTWNTYTSKLKEYDKQLSKYFEAEEAAELKKKTNHSKEIIKRAKKKKLDKKYIFSVSKEGNILAKLKEERRLGSVRSDFKITGEGTLRDMNPWIGSRYKMSKYNYFLIFQSIPNWNATKVKKGEVFTLYPDRVGI